MIPRSKNKEKQGIEAESRELLVKAYIVYEELLKAFVDALIDDYREAFLLYVLLMVHRISFNHQYEVEENCYKEEQLYKQKAFIEQIECIFSKNQLTVNQAEIIALLNYVETKEESNAHQSRGTSHYRPKCS